MSTFVIETDPTPEHVQYLEDRFYEFNASVLGLTDGQDLAISVRDERDRIIAGIGGHTWVDAARSDSFGWKSRGAGKV